MGTIMTVPMSRKVVITLRVMKSARRKHHAERETAKPERFK
jgi:hypothetical protein